MMKSQKLTVPLWKQTKKDKLAEEPFGSQKEVQLTDADLPF